MMHTQRGKKGTQSFCLVKRHKTFAFSLNVSKTYRKSFWMNKNRSSVCNFNTVLCLKSKLFIKSSNRRHPHVVDTKVFICFFNRERNQKLQCSITLQKEYEHQFQSSPLLPFQFETKSLSNAASLVHDYLHREKSKNCQKFFDV